MMYGQLLLVDLLLLLRVAAIMYRVVDAENICWHCNCRQLKLALIILSYASRWRSWPPGWFFLFLFFCMARQKSMRWAANEVEDFYEKRVRYFSTMFLLLFWATDCTLNIQFIARLRSNITQEAMRSFRSLPFLHPFFQYKMIEDKIICYWHSGPLISFVFLRHFVSPAAAVVVVLYGRSNNMARTFCCRREGSLHCQNAGNVPCQHL